MSLLDTGGKTIKLTLWDDHKDVVTENDMSNPVIAIKGVRVSDFNGRSLSTTRSSMVCFCFLEPESWLTLIDRDEP